MYELGHILLLLWGGQVRVVGSQGMEDSPAVAAQFLAILRAILPKLAVPLWKEADQGSVRFSPTRNLQSSLLYVYFWHFHYLRLLCLDLFTSWHLYRHEHSLVYSGLCLGQGHLLRNE